MTRVAAPVLSPLWAPADRRRAQRVPRETAAASILPLGEGRGVSRHNEAVEKGLLTESREPDCPARTRGAARARVKARHQSVHFHFTPTHGSWLNLVEVSFGILVRQPLAGASFTSPKQVRERIDAFIAAYNPEAYPFEWTKQAVFSKHPRAKYAN